MSAEYKLEPAEAQYVALSGGSHAWVIPGTAGACLFVQGSPARESAGTCGSVTHADAGMIMLVTTDQSTGVKEIFGLAPDGNSSVSLTGSDGSTVQVPVVSNVYDAPTSASSQSLTVRGADGEPTVIPLPGH
ncbi:MAG: hypothetical protein ACLPUT_18115 [Solirubrobacteraceae bacterium]